MRCPRDLGGGGALEAVEFEQRRHELPGLALQTLAERFHPAFLLRFIGPLGDQLLAIARDESQPNFIRARATAELERYPNEQTWDFLASQVTSSEGITRRRAVDNLCAIFVAEREGAVMELLASPLADADPHLRIRAATCLRRMESARAAGMLKNWRAAAEPWEVEAALP